MLCFIACASNRNLLSLIQGQEPMQRNNDMASFTRKHFAISGHVAVKKCAQFNDESEMVCHMEFVFEFLLNFWVLKLNGRRGKMLSMKYHFDEFDFCKLVSPHRIPIIFCVCTQPQKLITNEWSNNTQVNIYINLLIMESRSFRFVFFLLYSWITRTFTEQSSNHHNNVKPFPNHSLQILPHLKTVFFWMMKFAILRLHT